MINLIKINLLTTLNKKNVSYNKIFSRFTSTTTTTVTTTTTQDNTSPDTSTQNTSLSVNNTSIPNVSSNNNMEPSPVIQPKRTHDDIMREIEHNNATLQAIIDTPTATVEEIRTQMSSFEKHRTENKNITNSNSDKMENDSSTESISDSVKHTTIEPLPHSPETIYNAMIPIMATCKITGNTIVEKLDANKTLFEECDAATVRQEALYNRIAQFVDKFGITKGVLKLGLGIGLAYTVYHLFRYRQIPLGGFIKGWFSSGTSDLPVSSTTVTAPTNITINMPSNILPETKQAVSAFASEFSKFIDGVSPQTWAIIGGGLWLLSKFRR